MTGRVPRKQRRRLPGASSLMSRLAAEKRTIAGPFREFYLNDPAVVPEAELKTEIQIPVL